MCDTGLIIKSTTFLILVLERNQNLSGTIMDLDNGSLDSNPITYYFRYVKDTKTVKTISKWILQQKRPCGRPKNQWIDCVEEA